MRARCRSGRAPLFLFVSLAVPLSLSGPVVAQEQAQQESQQKPQDQAPAEAVQPSANQKVFDALDRKADFDFDETPLEEIAKRLEDQLGLQVIIDERSLADLGIGTDTPLTYRSEGESVGSALDVLLYRIDSTYVAQEGLLLITARETADEMLDVLVYPVSDLIRPTDPLATTTCTTFGCFPAIGSPAFAGTAQQLERLIQGSVALESWDDQGGPGSIAISGGSLIIRQTQRVHRRVASLLRALREMRSEQGSSQLTLSRYPRNAAIAKALDSPVTVKFKETPLVDICAYLMDTQRVPVKLDEQGFDDLGIGVETDISCDFKSKSLRLVLKHILDSLDSNLVVVPLEDMLLITSTERAAQLAEITLYQLKDLTDESDKQSDIPTPSELIDSLVETVDPDTWSDIGGPGSHHVFGSIAVISQGAEVQSQIAQTLAQLRQAKRDNPLPEISADEVELHAYPIYIFTEDKQAKLEQTVNLVTRLVEPKSWTGGGGEGVIEPLDNSLVIKNSRRVHFEVRKLLSQLGLWSPQPPTAGTMCFPGGGGLGGGGFGGANIGGGFF